MVGVVSWVLELVSHHTDTHLYVFSLVLVLPLIINTPLNGFYYPSEKNCTTEQEQFHVNMKFKSTSNFIRLHEIQIHTRPVGRICVFRVTFDRWSLSLHVVPSNSPNLYLCSVLWVTTLMYHGRDVHGWVRKLDVSPSTRNWSVEVYVSQVPHQGETVVFGYIEVSCEHYTPNLYRYIRT